MTNLISMNNLGANVFQEIHCTLAHNTSTIEDMIGL